MGAIGDFFGGLLDPIGTAYKIYQDQRNFNYEKKLQQQVFSREDNAYQRAVADAQAAGLSKAVVSGGAGSGSVLGASSTDIGSTDFYSRYQQRKMNALSLKQQMQDYSMSETQARMLEAQAGLQDLEWLKAVTDLRTTPGVTSLENDGYQLTELKYDADILKKIRQQRFDAEMAELGKKQVQGEWAQSNEVLDRIFQLLGVAAQFAK